MFREAKKNVLESMPTELQLEIFSFLPLRKLANCSVLNKSTQALFTNNLRTEYDIDDIKERFLHKRYLIRRIILLTININDLYKKMTSDENIFPITLDMKEDRYQFITLFPRSKQNVDLNLETMKLIVAQIDKILKTHAKINLEIHKKITKMKSSYFYKLNRARLTLTNACENNLRVLSSSICSLSTGFLELCDTIRFLTAPNESTLPSKNLKS